MVEQYTQKLPSAAKTEVPALISKKWLCVRFGIHGRADGALYKKVLTPDVIQQLGVEPEQIRNQRIRVFDAVTSNKLKEILSL